MAKYSNTKAKINEKITTNGAQSVTGSILNDVLQTMVDSLGADYQFGGLVQPGSSFTAGEQPVVFLATTPGTYTNFGGLVVADGEVALLVWSGSAWSKQTTDISTRTELNQLGQYVDNPEWVKVVTDSEDKILYGVKADGKFYFGDGCPPQVKEFVQENFVYKKDGKSLIDADFASSQEAIENLEWLQVTTDSEGKVLGGRKKDGTVVENMPQENPVAIEEYIEDSEFIDAKVDKDGKFISGTKKDGTVYIRQLSYHVSNGDEANVDILNIKKRGIKKLYKDLGLDYIRTNKKEQDFCSLFKDADSNVESFIFFSDPHYFLSYDKCEIKEDGIEYLKKIKDTFDNTPTDFVISGGDWLNAHKQSVAIKDLGWIDGFMNSMFPNCYYPVFGNHDNNYQGELDDTEDTSVNDGILSNQQMVNLWFRKYGKMYYSFKGNNTTFYVFDTVNDWVWTMDSYKWEQVAWFANNLLNNSEQHIVILLHIVDPISQQPSEFGNHIVEITENVFKVADAFNNRNSITLNSITYDFQNSQGKVHCALCGHSHYDAIQTLENIPVYCIDDAIEGNFDLILLDYGQNKLKSVRVGSGYNREMNLI